MGQHKHNPTAIAAKEGKLPPKQKSNMSKREERYFLYSMINAAMYEKTGIGLAPDGGIVIRNPYGGSVKIGGKQGM